MIADGSSPVYFGLQHDLSSLIRTHLFVLCPNNSGSTFLKNVLRSSNHTWNLAREGQRTTGFAGPRPREKGRQLMWSGKSEWISEYIEPSNFDWDVTKRAWYAQATANCPTASVMVEKSPPFVFLVDQLLEHFQNAKFLMMVRDPYATYEGIIRRRVPRPPNDGDDPRVLAAQHLVASFRQQIENATLLGERSVSFTYEQMCADPHACAAKITGLVPELDDIDLDQVVPVKGMYDERLRNMNDDQLERLSVDDVAVATEVFDPHEDLFAHFGYVLR